MKIRFSEKFINDLSEQVVFIAKDKPKAARKFKNDLLRNISKDLKTPFNFRKSIYFDDELIRDYIFKGYTITFKVNLQKKEIIVFGFIKYKNSL